MAQKKPNRQKPYRVGRSRTGLGLFATAPIERTATIFIGRVLASEDFRESALYDAAYQRRFRGRGD